MYGWSILQKYKRMLDCACFLQHNGKEANHQQLAASAAKVGIDYELSTILLALKYTNAV